MDAVTRKFGSQDFHGTRKLGSIELNAVAKEAVPSVSENIAEELDRTKDIAWEDFVYPYAEATTLGTKVAASGLDKMNSPVFSNDFSSDLFSPVWSTRAEQPARSWAPLITDCLKNRILRTATPKACGILSKAA